MSKIRVYELARELKIESKLLVTRIQAMGIEVASHQSTLTADNVIQIRRSLKDGEHSSSIDDPSQKNTQVVIRRRRKIESEVELRSEADESASAVVDPQALEDQIDRAEDDYQSPSGSRIASVAEDEGSLEENAESRPSFGEEEVISKEVETGKIIAKSTATTSEELEKSKRPAKVRSGERPREPIGATIVKKASPEEVEARKEAVRVAEQKKNRVFTRDVKEIRTFEPKSQRDKDSPTGDQVSSKPDFKFSVREKKDDFTDLDPWADSEAGRLSRSPAKKKTSTKEDEEHSRRVALKVKRDNLNTRTLLSAVEEDDLDAQNRLLSGGRKTVYTPTSSNRKRDLKRRKDLKKTKITVPRESYRIVKMGHDVTVAELGKAMGVKATELIKKLMAQGVMVSINQSIDFDTAVLISGEYSFKIESNLSSESEIIAKSIDEKFRNVEQFERSPIVTVMGHVDHGKTSILDAIKNSDVAGGEAGGITQHIGAYTVDVKGKKIAFLDTPGHEAFSAMRYRGAVVTDIVVLVVAADDGVMPQTVEAISHARAASVPIIVAINKIDKPNVNLDRVYQELMQYSIQPEEWGGEHQFVKVSALQRTGITELLEAILLQAEILELKASPLKPAIGVVVEAHLDKGQGPVATVMVQDGTLRVGDFVVVGSISGRVRALKDHLGKSVEEALPSTPVKVIGLSEVPMAGDRVNVTEDEKVAKELIQLRVNEESKRGQGKSSAATLEELLGKVKDKALPEVPVILKADTQGSVEAIADAILKIKSDKIKNKIIHKAVGGVTESDITLAATSSAVVIAFNVRAGRGLDELAERLGVPIKYFSIIYEVVDTLKALMAGSLPPILHEEVQGHAEVRATINVPKVGVVAGTAVLGGKITRNSQLRLIRDNVVIYSGKLGSLRRFKDDVKEVVQGYECGIGIDGYNDIKEGDIIESFVIKEEAATL